ncbi:acetyl-CoA carboxylase carboxyl transferase subunit beta [Candidatus Hakubella thermalkaliphila]|uniref:Acetyl-coenzyme A carboxylase carboxyl transferase subunit beta n=4 Tax=Candidatus Hakubella thermalkaliphila TaxID=2754717 RepID=A0A6V8PBX2_9ACTN|nr:acetyl-CoA carboxylase, carboxyltransferase subunit beta [Candidatus Hakubella thermalkaliphila]GFP18638.1 acetyl-CoA carboxylase carboxyl transferase subunit beta [Candidatus Hakubella thermalkaliphila]GFP29788.1 acetyl-CoA carboxylase carboxyl transferase subunit beta [Candidatus Hakubella thermalkaliphila]GFP38524.1 acetyl-CoA carboxylase carboxyl transferase subunit beta [Candidatus Hakubella thermalkaliphila]
MEQRITVEITKRDKPELKKEEKQDRAPSGVSSNAISCTKCGTPIDLKDLEKNWFCCPQCDFHMPLSARKRIELLVDPGSFSEFGEKWTSTDPLNFFDLKSYQDRINDIRAETGVKEAMICGRATISDHPVVLCFMDFAFMGGSMGCVVGEKFVRAVDIAIEERRPLIVFTTSGGARMQEGILSLMQMAKTTCAVQRLETEKIPYISVLANPTTGGVLASFALQADVILAEPEALICFTGPRVIKQTIGKELPEGFGKAEFCLSHGQLDMIVSRKELRKVLTLYIDLLEGAVQCEYEEPEPAFRGLPKRGGKIIRGIREIKKVAFDAWRSLGRHGS